MSELAIRVENLGKQYKIGARIERYATLRDSIARVLAHPLRRARNKKSGEDCLWALRDVSLEIKHGEIVGIIGRNGAGKTTLLKILSRITEPTQGRAEIYGRVGSLLEVGTGFHPELTGRENIYLNGAILGMRKAEIDRKFDEIVDFAEVEKFLDTPVKRYSSGMYVRLAFAVAANLEPDILMVDEVLAVGDVAFQKKCLGKMDEVARGGRTVLFVSHNLTGISTLTSKCMLLNKGELEAFGTSSGIIRKYIENIESSKTEIFWSAPRPGNEIVKLESCKIGEGKIKDYTSDQDIKIEITFIVKKSIIGLRVGYDLISSEGITIFRTFFDDQYKELRAIKPGRYSATCLIPANILNQGTYYITLRASIHGIVKICVLEHLLNFSVINLSGSNAVYGGNRPGILNMNLHWNIGLLK
jgi:lipopolysaccharide transport system ATP-binding protein